MSKCLWLWCLLVHQRCLSSKALCEEAPSSICPADDNACCQLNMHARTNRCCSTSTPAYPSAEAASLPISLESKQSMHVDLSCTAGRVGAGVSSGGIAMKTPGRVGEAAMYACGCWAVDADPPLDRSHLLFAVQGLHWCHPKYLFST